MLVVVSGARILLGPAMSGHINNKTWDGAYSCPYLQDLVR